MITIYITTQNSEDTAIRGWIESVSMKYPNCKYGEMRWINGMFQDKIEFTEDSLDIYNRARSTAIISLQQTLSCFNNAGLATLLYICIKNPIEINI